MDGLFAGHKADFRTVETMLFKIVDRRIEAFLIVKDRDGFPHRGYVALCHVGTAFPAR